MISTLPLCSAAKPSLSPSGTSIDLSKPNLSIQNATQGSTSSTSNTGVIFLIVIRLSSANYFLTSPFQCDRSAHGMTKLATVTFHLQAGAFQPEVPFCRTIRIVNQHQVRIMLQTFRLICHGLAVLLHE